MEIKNVKKIFVYIGVTLVLCLASAFFSICISRKGDLNRITELEQQSERQIIEHNQLINSARFGAREMARNLKATETLNKQLVSGLIGTKKSNRANIEILRRAISDSGRTEQILKSILDED